MQKHSPSQQHTRGSSRTGTLRHCQQARAKPSLSPTSSLTAASSLSLLLTFVYHLSQSASRSEVCAALSDDQRARGCVIVQAKVIIATRRQLQGNVTQVRAGVLCRSLPPWDHEDPSSRYRCIRSRHLLLISLVQL